MSYDMDAIKGRLDKLIEAIDRLTKAVEKALSAPAAHKQQETFGVHVCDLPSGHPGGRHSHKDSRQPPGYQDFST